MFYVIVICYCYWIYWRCVQVWRYTFPWAMEFGGYPRTLREFIKAKVLLIWRDNVLFVMWNVFVMWCLHECLLRAMCKKCCEQVRNVHYKIVRCLLRLPRCLYVCPYVPRVLSSVSHVNNHDVNSCIKVVSKELNVQYNQQARYASDREKFMPCLCHVDP